MTDEERKIVDHILSTNSEVLKEDHDKTMDPPNMLVMKRKSIRQFSNNQRVALYYVDKIDKYVTVPYTAMQWSSSGATSSPAEEL